MKWTALVTCVLTLLVPATSFAQEFRSKDRLNSELQTQLVNAPPLLEAALRAAGEEGRSGVEFAQQREQRSWRSRHPVAFGSLVGAGGGSIVVPIAYLSATGGSDAEAGFPQAPVFAVVGAGIGAGVGALTGWIISVARR